ncbi:quinone-dependent dihydroorotate dehydrogenase [Candidatus Leptofilum sp.]|uniref:quinone-dependent dihydroorotate dehydrogenase n=1 Tax=Candidatus Leptofilum sp. TaxID=3241576 RepID=UPI003B5AF870
MANFYQRFVFPILRRMDAETVHERTLSLLALAQGGMGRPFLKKIAGHLPKNPVEFAGLTFPNVLGMAAGFDKDVRVVPGLAALGFGHIEVGTLTPRPQVGNPRPRIFRLPEDGAIINRMGFPNGGVQAALPRLRKLAEKPHDFILGVSLGKQKETPLAEAASDYITVMQAVYPFADYLAVNISSPNTPGLRELQGGDYLGQLLGTLAAENETLAEAHKIGKRPLFVKIAPDLTLDELDEILTAVQNHKIDAIIATNTTIRRDGLCSPKQNETGGLSGLPVCQQSTEIIQHIWRQTSGKLPIIGVGGIRTAVDVQAKLDAGASLVQLYTSLIYQGPGLPGHLLREKAKLPKIDI